MAFFGKLSWKAQLTSTLKHISERIIDIYERLVKMSFQLLTNLKLSFELKNLRKRNHRVKKMVIKLKKYGIRVR